jgi:hypothetical protein
MVRCSGEYGRVYPFPISRLKEPGVLPLFCHPCENGDPEESERENKEITPGKRAINPNAPDLDSHFRGNDGKERGLWGLESEKRIKLAHRFLQRTDSIKRGSLSSAIASRIEGPLSRRGFLLTV